MSSLLCCPMSCDITKHIYLIYLLWSVSPSSNMYFDGIITGLGINQVELNMYGQIYLHMRMCDNSLYYLVLWLFQRPLFLFYPANYSASVGTLHSRERGVLSSGLMDNRHISLCQCHLSARLKTACEIKACLTGSAINATLDSHTAASASLFTLHLPSLSLPLFLTYFSLFPTPLGICHVCLQQYRGNLKQERFY